MTATTNSSPISTGCPVTVARQQHNPVYSRLKYGRLVITGAEKGGRHQLQSIHLQTLTARQHSAQWL